MFGTDDIYINVEFYNKTPMTIDENEKLLRFLDLQSGRLDRHVDKIWEEMKHFSAVLYILLGAPFFFEKDLNNTLLIFFPLLAIFVAYIAYISIHKENNDVLDALGTVLSIERRLKFHEECVNEIPANIVSEERKGRIRIGESIHDFIIRESSQPRTNSFRGLFELYFIGLFILGILETVFILYSTGILNQCYLFVISFF